MTDQKQGYEPSPLAQQLQSCSALLKEYEDQSQGLIQAQLRIEERQPSDAWSGGMVFIIEMRKKIGEDDYRYIARQIPARLVESGQAAEHLLKYAAQTFRDVNSKAPVSASVH